MQREPMIAIRFAIQAHLDLETSPTHFEPSAPRTLPCQLPRSVNSYALCRVNTSALCRVSTRTLPAQGIRSQSASVLLQTVTFVTGDRGIQFADPKSSSTN